MKKICALNGSTSNLRDEMRIRYPIFHRNVGVVHYALFYDIISQASYEPAIDTPMLTGHLDRMISADITHVVVEPHHIDVVTQIIDYYFKHMLKDVPKVTVIALEDFYILCEVNEL